MNFEVTILGCSSAIPTKDRNPTAQLVSLYGRYYLLDCGEGTQIQLRKYKLSFQRIDCIFITHVHADHFLGLPGLLSTMDLLGRKTDLHIYAPEKIKEFLYAYSKTCDNEFRFNVIFHDLNMKKHSLIFENEHMQVFSLPVKHSVPCVGYLFEEKKRQKKLKKEVLEKYFLTVEQIIDIKNGADLVLENGTIIDNIELTTEPPTPKKYAFITDTAYYPKIVQYIQDYDLVYHEATFADNMEKRAKATLHSTASQAAKIAQSANVKKLILGHYSVRYKDTEEIYKDALKIFKNVECVKEGNRYEL